MSKNENNLTDHDYDGIQEYDNNLPVWWLAIFIGTVIFGFIYWIHYEFGGGPNLQTELKQEMDQLHEAGEQHQHHHDHGGSALAASEEELLKLMSTPEILAKGKLSFKAKCASCHGEELQGIIGPNLVDEYWIHGQGKLAQIQAVVTQGVAEKGMPAWGAMLKEDEIESIVAFIGSQKGTTPANSKGPQGDKVVNN